MTNNLYLHLQAFILDILGLLDKEASFKAILRMRSPKAWVFLAEM